MKKIDAIITWVDGNDPLLRAKREKYGQKDFFASEDVAAKTRFDSMGEIFWCVASMNVFAKFLNKIYIVTDGQDPHLEPVLKEWFPDGYIPVEIVDHKTIFKGYEKFLPTFNSISIETMTWRIPGLSEHYIEFNDDFMLCKEVHPEDFFTEEGKLVCYASKFSQLITTLTRFIKPRRNGRKKVTFKGLMMNAATVAGQKHYFLKLGHTPRALRKSFFEQYYADHPEDMIRNIQYRFRDARQFTSQELQYILQYRQRNCILRSVDDNLFFLQPKKKRNYVQHKLDRLKGHDQYKFCCFNSIDLASDEDRHAILEWIESRLGIALSNYIH